MHQPYCLIFQGLSKDVDNSCDWEITLLFVCQSENVVLDKLIQNSITSVKSLCSRDICDFLTVDCSLHKVNGVIIYHH